MIEAILSLGHNQFEHAKWYESDREHHRLIDVSVVSERERRFSTILKNKGLTDDSTLLETHYRYSYQVKQEIFYRDSWWIIRSVLENTNKINPQALSILKPEYNMTYYLEILKVD